MEQTDILLVNDGSALLTWLGGLLESRGYAVVITARSDEAVTILRTQDVDMVVVKTDARRHNHLAMLLQVKSLCPEAKLVIISEKASLPVEALEIDADDYLILPARPSEIWQRLRAFIPQKAPGFSSPKQPFLHQANASVMVKLVLMLLDLQCCLVSTVTGVQDLWGLLDDHVSEQNKRILKDITSRNWHFLVFTQEFLDTFLQNNYLELWPKGLKPSGFPLDLS